MFSGQPVALVVADTFELARYAASLVRVDYKSEPHETDLTASGARLMSRSCESIIDPPIQPRGDAGKAFARAAVQLEAEYAGPAEHHNAMELFATTVVWEGGGKLTVYDKTQGPQNNQKYICKVFELSDDDVRLLSPFVGGGFGWVSAHSISCFSRSWRRADCSARSESR